MKDEAAWIADRIERLKALHRGIDDERALSAIKQLITEAEDRLAELRRLRPSNSSLSSGVLSGNRSRNEQ